MKSTIKTAEKVTAKLNQSNDNNETKEEGIEQVKEN
jgi:hypothetical protein